uniref:Uncharacterized protein n=1 Tax=Romanomermis culicivorax TaxID=13658 RepID=A0A915JGH4_ROMCU
MPAALVGDICWYPIGDKLPPDVAAACNKAPKFRLLGEPDDKSEEPDGVLLLGGSDQTDGSKFKSDKSLRGVVVAVLSMMLLTLLIVE